MDDTSQGYDIDALSQELELDIGELAGLFSGYIDEMRSEAVEMKKYLAQNHWEMLQRIVHNIKGVSVNLGVDDVFKEAQKFDLLLKSGHTGDASINVHNLICLLETAEEKIRSYFSGKGFII